MQFSLDPIDWRYLTSFKSFREYLEASDLDETSAHQGPQLRPRTDSALQYFAVAEALVAVSRHLEPTEAARFAAGLGRIIAENGHVDELGAGEETEGHYWITASPATTRELLANTEALSLPRILEVLRLHSPRQPGWSPAEIETILATLYEDHLYVLRSAVASGFGVLGHIG